MKILLLAFSFKTQYHVLRCFSQNNAEIHVLGSNLARGLSYSRYCSSYHEFHYNPLKMTLQNAAREINKIAEDLDIDYVVPSDIISTKLLIRIRDSIFTKVPLLPDINTFNKLANKWSFYQFSKEIDLPVPKTYNFTTPSALISSISNGELSLPIIIKPTDGMGSYDILIIKNQSDLEKLRNVTYHPILAQEYLSGRDCGISMICKNGAVISSCFQRHYSWGYEFDNKHEINNFMKQIAHQTNYSGIAHFDLLEIVEDKSFVFIECNPRSWYSIFALMLAGLNYALLSLDDSHYNSHAKLYLDSKVQLKVNKALFKSLLNPFNYRSIDIKTFTHYLSDPIPYISERFSIYDDLSSTGPGSIVNQIDLYNAII